MVLKVPELAGLGSPPSLRTSDAGFIDDRTGIGIE